MRRSIAIALTDQAVLSLFNLGLNMVLIALAAPAEFGRFVLVSAAILFATSIQNALVTTPIAVMTPGRPEAERRSMLDLLLAFDRWFRPVAAAATVLACLLTDYDAPFLAAAALAIHATLGRETARSVLLAGDRVALCLRIDAIAVVLSIAFVGLAWLAFAPATAALLAIAAGSYGAVASAPLHEEGWRTLMPAAPLMRPRALWQSYRNVWQETRWSLVGAATTELQYRSYVFALEVFRDAATLAAVQAGRLLLGPLPLVVAAWAKVARPAMARHLAVGDRQATLRLTLWGLVFVLSVAAAFYTALYLAWPLVEQWIFKGRYARIELMTIAWAGYTTLVVTHIVLSTPLQAALEFKQLAKVTMVTASLTTALLAGLALPVPAIYAIGATAAGEVVALVWMVLIVQRVLGADGPPIAVPVSLEAGHGTST